MSKDNEVGIVKARTKEEFEGALHLLVSGLHEAERTAVFEEAGSDKAATLLMVGEYMRERIERATALVDGAASDDLAARREAVTEAMEVVEMSALLRESVSAEIFDAVSIEAVEMNRNEADRFRSLIEDLSDFADGAVIALEEKSLVGNVIEELRETPEWRSAVMRKTARQAGDSLSDLSSGRFGHFLDCLELEAAPAVKAELTAKLELYIKSGWAARDCLYPEMPDDTRRTTAAQGVRAMLENPGEGQKGRRAALTVLSKRFSELFHSIEVIRSQGEGGEDRSLGEYLGTIGRKGSDAVARSGMVDCAIVDARNPALIHAAVVTADDSTFIENTQTFRHYEALRELISRNGVVVKGEPVRAAALSFYAPSMFYGDGSAGREIGKPILEALSRELRPEERESLNVIPFMSSLSRIKADHPHYAIEDLADFRLRLIGAPARSWEDSMDLIRRIDDRDEKRKAFLEVCVRNISGAVDALSLKKDDGRLFSVSGDARKFFSTLAEAVEGALEQGVSCPEVLRPLERRADLFSDLLASMKGDSEVHGRFNRILDTLCHEGGIEAWARARQQRDAVVAQRKAERVAEEKVSGQKNSTLVDTLRLSLFSDTGSSRSSLGVMSSEFLDEIDSAIKVDLREGRLSREAYVEITRDIGEVMRLRGRTCAEGLLGKEGDDKRQEVVAAREVMQKVGTSVAKAKASSMR